MTVFDRMKISTRLSLGFGLVITLLVLVAGRSRQRMYKSGRPWANISSAGMGVGSL